MSIKEAESSIAVLEAELAKLDAMDPHADELRLQIDHLREEAMLQLDAWDTVYLARHPKRPKAADYIRALFPDFMELHGDRCYGDDAACQGGIATFHGRSVTVLAQSKGKTLEENMQRNFGMLHPEGYRHHYAGRYCGCVSGKGCRGARTGGSHCAVSGSVLRNPYPGACHRIK